MIPIGTYPSGERGKGEAVRAAIIVDFFDFGNATGALSSPGSSRVWTCMSHPDCTARVKVVNFEGDRGFALYKSIESHSSNMRQSLKKNFKGISAEFSALVDEFISKGRTPKGIVAELTIGCGANETQKERIPSTAKISARKISLLESSTYKFETFADMMAFCSGRLVTSQADFDRIVDLDELIVYSTFSGYVYVTDESEGALGGAVIRKATFGFNFGSKRTALQLRRVRCNRPHQLHTTLTPVMLLCCS